MTRRLPATESSKVSVLVATVAAHEQRSALGLNSRQQIPTAPPPKQVAKFTYLEGPAAVRITGRSVAGGQIAVNAFLHHQTCGSRPSEFHSITAYALTGFGKCRC